MATVNKDFKIKSGLIVEGLQGTINGEVILTENAGDQYILDLIGGETLVKSVSNEFDVSVAGQLSLDRTVVDAYYDAAGDAADAEQAAKSYADGLASNYDPAGSATTAENNAKGYADSLAPNYDPAGAADTAEDNANSYTDQTITNLNLAGTYDALGAATTALNDAKAYTDQEVAALVDSAPELLDTLNELAAAIADNPNYATDVANLIADKADTSYVNQEISDLDTAAQGYATAAENNAKGYADSLATNYDAAGSAASAAATALQDAKDYADALDTDDVAEGTAQYFTDARAKSSAADLLTGATLTNITITGSGAGLTITAENGVADSTTSDLAEGSNLYFTDARARTAVDGTSRSFTSVELNSVAKQVAATLEAATAGIQVAHAFAKADYRSAEYLVKVAYGTHTEISKVLLTLDSSDNIAITEYGIVGTNGSASSISAGISGANVQLQVTTANNNSTVTVMGTLLK